MKHPTIVLLPLLMFADYFLTILGAIQKERKYSEHFKTQHYELNPVWQKAVSRKQWLNPRHIALTLVTTGALACLLELGDLPEPTVEGFLGCLFVFFGMVVGRHLSNLLLFRRLARKPEEVSGQVVITHSLSLAISTYQYLVVAVPVVLMAFFAPTPFVLGGLVGTGLIFVVHFAWILKHKAKASNKTDTGDSK